VRARGVRCAEYEEGRWELEAGSVPVALIRDHSTDPPPAFGGKAESRARDTKRTPTGGQPRFRPSLEQTRTEVRCREDAHGHQTGERVSDTSLGFAERSTDERPRPRRRRQAHPSQLVAHRAGVGDDTRAAHLPTPSHSARPS
jgi:hypothetical protein